MPPTWIPLCRAMQRYCEPYFAAVERWRNSTNSHILVNRIQLLETAERLFSELSQRSETYVIDLVCENPGYKWVDEVEPTAGKAFVFGGDREAFEASKKLVPKDLFNRIGLYFQIGLLKSIAGISDTYLSTANIETRKSITDCVEKLFRLPEEAGIGRFVYRVVDPFLPENGSDKNEIFNSFPTASISKEGKSFLDFLMGSEKRTNVVEGPKLKRALVKASEPSKKRTKHKSVDSDSDQTQELKSNSHVNARKTAKQKKEKISKTPVKSEERKRRVSTPKDETSPKKESTKHSKSEEIAEPEWTEHHHSVGKRVANFFLSPDEENPGKTKSKIFFGIVTKYAPPSTSDLEDQLYHVEWEDGDCQDMDEIEYFNARDLYQIHTKWITENHPALGLNVANYFNLNGKKNDFTLFQGKVTKFCPATSSRSKDQLYHIVWEDGDEEDYDQTQLDYAIQVYEENYEKSNSNQKAVTCKNKGGKSKNKKRKEIDQNNNDDDNDNNDHNNDHQHHNSTTESIASNGDSSYFCVNASNLVGTKIVKFHASSDDTERLIIGEVGNYDEAKQQYHILWTNGEEESYDEAQYVQGLKLMAIHMKGKDFRSHLFSSWNRNGSNLVHTTDNGNGFYTSPQIQNTVAMVVANQEHIDQGEYDCEIEISPKRANLNLESEPPLIETVETTSPTLPN